MSLGSRIGWLAMAVIATALAQPLASLSAADRTPPPTQSQIRAWLEQLDSNQFAERETATERLGKSGKVAVAEMKKFNLSSHNLEVVSRGVMVLRELALAEDAATEEAARDLLETLSVSHNEAAAKAAQNSLGALNELRYDRTVAQLRELGVVISVSSSQIGLILVHEMPMVEINDNFKGKPEDLKRLKYLNDIRLVQLSGDKINNEVLARVAELRQVQYLKIKWSKVTAAGLAPFANSPELKHVSILYSPVSDDVVATLGKISTLETVRLYGTQVTRLAADRLVASLGDANKVDLRDGAFLGIGGDRGTRGCEITLVQPGSAAQKAGLQVGDVVVRFAGVPIADFQGLTATISKFKARDTVTFDILRDFREQKVEVRLGEWEW